MNIVIPLVIVIALILVAKPKNAQAYRVALISLFGVSFFVIWKYLAFYNHFVSDDLGMAAPQLIFLFGVVTVIALLPPVRKITQVSAYFMAACFIAALLASYVFDEALKNHVSRVGGFYRDGGLLAGVNSLGESENFAYHAGGYSLRIPKHWQEKSLGSGLKYFQGDSDGVEGIELRPMCFHDSTLTMPEVVENAAQRDLQGGYSISRVCEISDGQSYNCLIKSKSQSDNRIDEIWRWISISFANDQKIEVDIVFYNKDPGLRDIAESVLHTMEYIPRGETESFCLSPSEWL